MKSLKIKLTSALIMVFVAIAMLIVGIYAAQTQTITMQGSVNFDIADKCLYVQDVRMQEDNNAEPYSLKDQGRFLPGYINGNFDMNLGTFTNTYGSFALYFDIINTINETSDETFAYTVEASTTQSGVTVGVSILDNNNSSIEQIPEGTVKPSQITQDTTLTASVKVTISASTGTQVDLSQITVTINQYVPKVYSDYSFTVDEEAKTATITDYKGNENNIIIPSTISRRNDGVYIDGSEYKLTSIGSNAFASCDSLTSVIIPNSVTSIGNRAFLRCSSLTSVTIPEGVTSIGDSAFSDCSSLTSVTIPNGVTSIGDMAFRYCRSLTSVTIPDSVISIGDLTFDDCTSLTSIEVDEDNANYSSDDYGVLYNKDKTTLIKYPIGNTRKNYSIPDNVDIISDSAFSNCSSLTSVTIPDSVTSIDYMAFSGCSSLTSINIPYGVTSISSSAFSGCSSLTSINIPYGVTSIGSYAFHWCDSLSNVTLPDSVTSIGDYAFDGCSSLKSVKIPENVTSIGDFAFQDCSSLESVTIPNGVSIIGSYTFYSCSSLTSVTIPYGVTNIGFRAFCNCRSLANVTIPDSVTSIGDYAFQNCSGLTSVTINAIEPPTFGSDMFYNCSKLTHIYVPVASVDKYKAASELSSYVDIISATTEQ